MRKGLFESLKNYSDSDFYPFHMPGHKRNSDSGLLADFYQMDITEIDGFDNLHQPESIIKEAQERAAKLYGSQETYFLVNGSTAGILSAVSAVAGRGERLIIARNCHKAVYHAAFLNRLKLDYIFPDILEDYGIAGQIKAESLDEKIREILSEDGEGNGKADKLIAGIVITSPTYDGICLDVEALAQVAHGYGIPLIVDQAHGAHFGMHPAYPENAVKQNADFVIHSVHKTLPAPTQTALIHRNGKLTDGELLRKYLRIYQSSSPSYLLMAGIDEGIRLTKEEGFARLDNLLRWREDFLKGLENCQHIQVCPYTEPGKLMISVKDAVISGQMLSGILREKYHLEMEMAAGNYVVAILTMMDHKEGLERLLQALLAIDRELSFRSNSSGIISRGNLGFCLLHSKKKAELWEAYLSSYEKVKLDEARGEISGEFINLYPPGIPILIPGEVIEQEAINVIKEYLNGGYTVQGVCENEIKVVRSSKGKGEFDEKN